MKGSHPDEPGSLRCGLCAKTFKEASELERHITAIHSTHDERLMRACSSLLPSHISAAIIKDEGSMLSTGKDHPNQGQQQQQQQQQTPQQAAQQQVAQQAAQQQAAQQQAAQQQAAQAAQQQAQAHFLAPEILEEDNPANELFET